jgi:phosphatidylglycerol:prolipoprotein diacylglycerol transferase
MKFPQGLPPTSVANLRAMGVEFPSSADPMQIVAVHPTQIYETALMLLAFWWMWRRRDHGHATGWMLGCYLVFAGLERFLVEFLRAKDDRLLGPFTIAQATSVVLVVAGALLLKVWWKPDGTTVSLPTLAPRPRG